MKKIICLSISLCFGLLTHLFGQIKYPDCDNLTVTSIRMDNDTANLMKITIANSCDTCDSWNNGPVYLTLRVIRTVSPFDTIADCNCSNYWTPPNKNSLTYKAYSTQSNLPQYGTYKVEFFNTCDSLPFSSTLDLPKHDIDNFIILYPNPTEGKIEIKTNFRFDYEINITDVQGSIVYKSFSTEKTKLIDIADLAPGVYVITLSNKQEQIGVKKIIRK